MNVEKHTERVRGFSRAILVRKHFRPERVSRMIWWQSDVEVRLPYLQSASFRRASRCLEKFARG